MRFIKPALRLCDCASWPMALALCLSLGLFGLPLRADQPMRIGMIGLDTSHAPAFAKLINQAPADSPLAKLRVTAAFPGGSEDLPTSRDRVEGFTNDLRNLDVEIVSSIDELLPKVDAILLESVDGRKHLHQALPVFNSGKPMFIDKPLAAELTDAIAIDLLGKHYKARWFSSSSLRFSPSIIRYRSPDMAGKVLGASAWSPCSLDPTHSDLFWYGIHGVESLYTAMGVGCQEVVRISSPDTDVVVGTWQDGRIGSFRGLRSKTTGYGLVVFGADKIELDAKYEGYQPLVLEIAKFFAGQEHPVSNEETLEIMTFMQAAELSKQRGGLSVQLQEVWQHHHNEAQQIVAEILKQ
jgi:hypothetical protein